MAGIVTDNVPGLAGAARIFSAIAPRPYSFFLDSALSEGKLSRYSFLGCEPFLVFKSKGCRISLERPGAAKESFRCDPFVVLGDLFEKYKMPSRRGSLPFTSGAVGYFSYDMKDLVERLPDTSKDDLGLPDCVLGFYDVVIIHDRVGGKTRIAGCGLPYTGQKGRRRSVERLKYFREIIKNGVKEKPVLSGRRAHPGLRSNFTKAGYIEAIKKAKDYIRKGDIYQVNLSQRFEARPDRDPASLYMDLRRLSPAPFAAYLGFGDVKILSSSPERFLLKRGRRIETRPIKGTRPRGRDAVEDRALERELVKSVKDNAEHIMIVDLERNDLGRVCDYGTVKPEGSPAVEKYADVFHLVSAVSGRVKKGLSAVDCLRSAFPGGSITGAPKVRAMEIIEELEKVKRSVYTGAIGYIGFDGNMDTSIAIRTLVVKGKKAYFSVGGGIVADSVPADEYRETLDKARGILRALGAG